MTMVTSGEFYRVRTDFAGVDGAPYYFSIAVQGTEPTQESVETVAGFWDAIKGHLSDGMTWTTHNEFPIYEVTTGNVIAYESDGSDIPGVGTNVNEQLPQMLQARVVYRTNEFVNGREVRGGFFIPGLTQDANDWGTIVSSTRTAINDAVEEMLGIGAFSLSGFNGAAMVYSTTHNRGALVASASTRARFAVLRTRSV